ncbi:MAG: GGDEF domain-containing protein [Lachnospiraceae bacterium]|nr:GGDEF domain-containing protein [Lachnospiraceae bacterium]
MNYSSVGILALILNCIINRNALKNLRSHSRMSNNKNSASYYFSLFIISCVFYYITDIAWGLCEEFSHIPAVHVLFNLDAHLYFFALFLTMLTWIRYLVAYLESKNKSSKIILHLAWGLFDFGMICLVINIFYPFVFTLSETNVYTAKFGRYILLIFQFALYLLTSLHLFFISRKAEEPEKGRYFVAGVNTLVMEIFMLIQLFEYDYALYSMGLIVGTCVAHSFVEAHEMKEKEIYDQIVNGLASNYDVIYYIDRASSKYVSYEFNNIYGQLEFASTGSDFFAESSENCGKIVHKNDQDLVIGFLNKDAMISNFEIHKSYSLDYRLMVNGRSKYTRMTARKTADGEHFIIGVENIDAEVRKEKQHLKALNTEKELARRDELTGIKNKTAYRELEKSVQSNMENGMDYLPFALVVCDSNDLKLINDTEGHAAGDEYIKASAKILCDIFKHSPVFRVGGDEFVVFIRGNDYPERHKLMDKLRSRVLQNQQTGQWPVLASGIAEYAPDTDNRVSDIFDRADKEMYKNKKELKSISA